jgi:undecaprenyl pyrophosphate phosphatase UppP
MLILVSFIAQILAEFFPISSTLLLKTLQLPEGMMFHIFSGFLFIFIYRGHFLKLIVEPVKNFSLIFAYALSVLPSLVVGLLVDYYNMFNFNFSLRSQIYINIFSAVLLYIVIANRKSSKCYINKKYELSIWDGFAMGLFTSLNGFLPGMSRLGTSMLYLIFRSYYINKAYEISLITSIPVLCCRPMLHLLMNYSSWHFLTSFIKTHFLIVILVMIVGVLLHKLFSRYMNENFLKGFLLLRIIYFVVILLLLYL